VFHNVQRLISHVELLATTIATLIVGDQAHKNAYAKALETLGVADKLKDKLT
jgi:Mn-containing catalase